MNLQKQKKQKNQNNNNKNNKIKIIKNDISKRKKENRVDTIYLKNVLLCQKKTHIINNNANEKRKIIYATTKI